MNKKKKKKSNMQIENVVRGRDRFFCFRNDFLFLFYFKSNFLLLFHQNCNWVIDLGINDSESKNWEKIKFNFQFSKIDQIRLFKQVLFATFANADSIFMTVYFKNFYYWLRFQMRDSYYNYPIIISIYRKLFALPAKNNARWEYKEGTSCGNSGENWKEKKLKLKQQWQQVRRAKKLLKMAFTVSFSRLRLRTTANAQQYSHDLWPSRQWFRVIICKI